MAQQECEGIGIKFVIRGSSSAPFGSFGSCPGLVDHLAILSANDVATVAPNFISRVVWSKPIWDVTIETPLKGRTDIGPILDALRRHLVSETSIYIQGAYIDFELLDRLLSEYPDVNLFGCALGKGWWRQSKRERICHRLWIQECTAALPPRSARSTATWPSLTWLTVVGTHWDSSLHGYGAIPDTPLPQHARGYGEANGEIVRALFGVSIDTLSIVDLSDASFLFELPDSEALEHLIINRCPIEAEITNWISRQENISSMHCTWKPGVRLPWQALSKLKKLRHLDVEGSPFDDKDLAAVLKHLKLRILEANYTCLTPASWPLLLSNRCMRGILVSTEMLAGEIPAGLPDTTRMRFVEGVNIGPPHREHLANLVSRYPNVKICDT
jgi:hypothetical protein